MEVEKAGMRKDQVKEQIDNMETMVLVVRMPKKESD